jgi:hypothetical protein
MATEFPLFETLSEVLADAKGYTKTLRKLVPQRHFSISIEFSGDASGCLASQKLG